MRVAVLLLAALAAVAAGPGVPRAETTIEASVWEAAGVVATPLVRLPALTLPEVSGRSRSLAEFKGRVVMLYFWATW
jgi:hypothetical protein